jgi:hypothetical protein
MINIADPVTQWAFIILISVVIGTCLLIAVAIFRRWIQIRYARYVHSLQRQYRPILAKVLSGVPSPAGMAALRELPLADVELLLDPLFSKRKLPEGCLVFLRALCAELGLIALWQSRLANGRSAASPSSGSGAHGGLPDRAVLRYLLRAKSIRNLGTLRHRPSWPLLVAALDDRHPDIQLVALRSLAALGAPESFPVLRERLHAVVQGKSASPPLQGLQAAMVSFDLTCAPALLPSLRHPDRQIRLHGAEILRTMVCREAARQPGFALPPGLLTPPMVELLLSGFAVDACSETRARAAGVIVFLANPRATSVLHDLLIDPQWFVRLRTLRALAQMRQAAAPLYLDIRKRLCDSHWRVREAAIQTLISLGPEGKHQLYEHFLTSPDRATREQIAEMIERTGLMSTLVEEYSAGKNGVDALMVEQLASNAAPLGLSGVLRTLNPEIRQRFLDRFVPHAEAKMRFLEETQPEFKKVNDLQQAVEIPPFLAA